MRAFIGISLQQGVRETLGGLQRDLGLSRADVKWVRPENIHLTIRFLGNITELDRDNITAALRGRCSTIEPFSLILKGTGTFPNSKNPKVIWAATEHSDPMLKLHADIEKALTETGFKPEERPFTPHLTLGRVGSSCGSKELAEKIIMHKEDKFGIISVDSVCLIKSELTPDGAIYSLLGEILLQGKSSQ